MKRRFNALLSIIMTLAVVLILGATASYAASVKNGTAYVDTPGDTAILRAKATRSSAMKDELSDNTKLTVKKIVFVSKTSTSSTNKWYYVSVNGKTGYIRADLVDGQKYTAIDAKVSKNVTYRKGAGTKMKKVGTLKKGTKVQVLLKATPVKSTKGSSSTWYMIKYKGKKYYACSAYFKLIDEPAPTPEPEPTPTTDEEFKADLEKQGFDSTYVDKLMKLHESHPKWSFQIRKINIDWNTAVSNQMNASQIQKNGKWGKATEKEIAYYMDPRNFIYNANKDENVFMFETFALNSINSSEEVVDNILGGTYLDNYLFLSSYFVNAGKEYGVSPVHLAARARQETGGSNCNQINGKPYSPTEKQEKKVVYNPFNIQGNTTVMKYAYEHNWIDKEQSVYAGAMLIKEEYIDKYGQNTIYFEKFNFNSSAKPSHQYMSNIKAPISESSIVYKAYKDAEKLDESFTFIIPVYKSMSESTSL